MKGQIRSILMIFSFLVGGVFHESLSQLYWLQPIGIGLMLSVTFIGVELRKLKPTWMHILIFLCIQLIGIGSWFIAKSLGYPVLAEALYYCGAAPIAAASPMIVGIIGGDIEFSATAMLLSQVVFAVLTPFVLPFVVHDPGLTYATLASLVGQQLIYIMVVPALVACVIRLIYPPSKLWAPKLRDFSLGIWIWNLTLIAAISTERMLQMHYSWHDIWPMALAAACICTFGFVAGYWLGYPKLKRECSQALGQKNTILTLYIANQPFATPLASVAPACYVFFHNVANAIQMALAVREKNRLAHATAAAKDGETEPVKSGSADPA